MTAPIRHRVHTALQEVQFYGGVLVSDRENFIKAGNMKCRPVLRDEAIIELRDHVI